MALRVGRAKIEIRRFGDVEIAAQVSDVTQVAGLARLVQLALGGIAAEDLAGRFEEDVADRNQPRHRHARIADAFFAANQVVDDERAIGPRQHVRVQRVDLAERRAHLAGLELDRSPGSSVSVAKPSSSSTPSSPNARKKSARAYGSTIAWNETSDSGISSAGDGLISLWPAAPRKLPITAMSGLKYFAPDAAAAVRGSDRLRRGRRRLGARRLRLGELRLERGDALAKFFLQLIDLLLQRVRVRLRLCGGAPRKQQQSSGHGRQAHRGDCSHSDLPNARVLVSRHVRFAPATPEASFHLNGNAESIRRAGAREREERAGMSFGRSRRVRRRE